MFHLPFIYLVPFLLGVPVAKAIGALLFTIGATGQFYIWLNSQAGNQTFQFVDNKLVQNTPLKEQEKEKRKTPDPNNQKRVGFPLPKNDNKTNNKTPSQNTADGSDTDDFLDINNPNSDIDKIKNRRLRNNPDPIRDLNDVDLNQPVFLDTVPHWQPIRLPSPRVNIGQLIYQPIADFEYDVFTAPVINDDNKALDPTQIIGAVQSLTTEEEVINFLAISSQTKVLGEYETNLKLEDLAIVFAGYMLNSNTQIDTIFGLKALWKLGEAFNNYSNGALTDPLFNIPTVIRVNTINGVTFQTINFNPKANQDLKPKDPEIGNRINQNIGFPDEQVAELDPDYALTFFGNTAMFEGGQQEFDKLNSDYKQNPQAFYDSPYIGQVPSIDDLLNGDVDINAPKLKNKPQPLKAKNKLDLIQQMLGVISVKLGLDQFPSELPSLQLPSFTLDQDGKRIYGNPLDPINVTSLAGGLAYGIAGLQRNIGRFPLEIEKDSEQKRPDPNNPKVLIPNKDHEYVPDLGNAITNLLTLGMASANIANTNFNLNVRNSRAIEEAKNAGLKAMHCACGALDATGMNKNQRKICTAQNFNFKDAKGVNDFLNPNNEACITSTSNDDNITIKEMLTDILFGVNIIKGAYFKGADDIENQIEIIRNMKDEIKEKDDKFDKFVDDFNNGIDPLNQGFPTKARLNVQNKQNPQSPT